MSSSFESFLTDEEFWKTYYAPQAPLPIVLHHIALVHPFQAAGEFWEAYHAPQAFQGYFGPNAVAPVPGPAPAPRNGIEGGLQSLDDLFSPNYAGRRVVQNASANIPVWENCALWVTWLPADVTFGELLGQIRGMGRVFATVINRPNHDQGQQHAAAKIVFFEHGPAQAFVAMSTFPGFFVRGHRAHVTRNRVRSAAVQGLDTASRVLVITGPPSMVNEQALLGFFASRFQFDLDQFLVRSTMGSSTTVEVRFGSYRCQAEAAFNIILREFPSWEVEFGADPCAVPNFH